MKTIIMDYLQSSHAVGIYAGLILLAIIIVNYFSINRNNYMIKRDEPDYELGKPNHLRLNR